MLLYPKSTSCVHTAVSIIVNNSCAVLPISCCFPDLDSMSVPKKPCSVVLSASAPSTPRSRSSKAQDAQGGRLSSPITFADWWGVQQLERPLSRRALQHLVSALPPTLEPQSLPDAPLVSSAHDANATMVAASKIDARASPAGVAYRSPEHANPLTWVRGCDRTAHINRSNRRGMGYKKLEASQPWQLYHGACAAQAPSTSQWAHERVSSEDVMKPMMKPSARAAVPMEEWMRTCEATPLVRAASARPVSFARGRSSMRSHRTTPAAEPSVKTLLSSSVDNDRAGVCSASGASTTAFCRPCRYLGDNAGTTIESTAERLGFTEQLSADERSQSRADSRHGHVHCKGVHVAVSTSTSSALSSGGLPPSSSLPAFGRVHALERELHGEFRTPRRQSAQTQVPPLQMRVDPITWQETGA